MYYSHEYHSRDRYIISILPTDAGITDMMLIIIFDTIKTYIEVISNVVLTHDLRQGCEGLKIDCIQRRNEPRRWANIIVTIINIIVTMTFNQYPHDLDQDDRLDPLFFDETHTLTKDTNWRHKFVSVRLLSFVVHFIASENRTLEYCKISDYYRLAMMEIRVTFSKLIWSYDITLKNVEQKVPALEHRALASGPLEVRLKKVVRGQNWFSHASWSLTNWNFMEYHGISRSNISWHWIYLQCL